jgi:hypothetical protein
MTTTSKPFRETLLQLLATVMIPVSVAGTGIYYTRWQQNLNDLKTMIDLVSDQNAEKRKYGVAMFEYLLKNDKVPVEFVAAQLAFANSSSDKELLPLMEQALLKASVQNSKVEVTFREALERLPSRLFVHTQVESQRVCVRTLIGKMRDTASTGLIVPGYARATWNGKGHELRVFLTSDLERGQELTKMFTDVGLQVAMKDLTAIEGRKARPNTFELWFGTDPVPASCVI